MDVDIRTVKQSTVRLHRHSGHRGLLSADEVKVPGHPDFRYDTEEGEFMGLPTTERNCFSLRAARVSVLRLMGEGREGVGVEWGNGEGVGMEECTCVCVGYE